MSFYFVPFYYSGKYRVKLSLDAQLQIVWSDNRHDTNISVFYISTVILEYRRICWFVEVSHASTDFV